VSLTSICMQGKAMN